MNFKPVLLFLLSVFNVAVSAQKVFEIHAAAFTEDTIPCFDPSDPSRDTTRVRIEMWQTIPNSYNSYLLNPVFNPFNCTKFAYIKRVRDNNGKRFFSRLVVADIETGRKRTIFTSSFSILKNILWLKPNQLIFLQSDTLFKIDVGSKVCVPIKTGVLKLLSVHHGDILIMDIFKRDTCTNAYLHKRDSTNFLFISAEGLVKDSMKINANSFLETDFSKDSFWVDAQQNYPAYNVMKYNFEYRSVMPFYNKRNELGSPRYMKWNPLQSTEWYMFNGHNLYRYDFATDSLICLKRFCYLKSFGAFDVSTDGKWILASSGIHIHTAVEGYCVNKSQLTLIRLSDLHEFIYVDR